MKRLRPLMLVVEDDPTIAHMLRKIFETWFWETLKAQTVEEGLKLLSPELDLIILDLMLPDGDGIDILKAAKSQALPAKIVVSTGRDVTTLSKVVALHPDQVLIKPFLFEPLRSLADDIAGRWKPVKID